jgi:hypothetical protein
MYHNFIIHFRISFPSWSLVCSHSNVVCAMHIGLLIFGLFTTYWIKLRLTLVCLYMSLCTPFTYCNDTGVRLGYFPREILQCASMTGGLVQESEHTMLPSISPLVTLILTVLSILVCLISNHHSFKLTFSLFSAWLSIDMEVSYAQRLSQGSGAVRLWLFYVWLACARESCFAHCHPSHVGIIFSFVALLTFLFPSQVAGLREERGCTSVSSLVHCWPFLLVSIDLHFSWSVAFWSTFSPFKSLLLYFQRPQWSTAW